VATEYRADEPSLVGPRVKFARAKEHLDEVEKAILSYVESDPYDIPQEAEREGEWIIIRLRAIRTLPDPRWGVRIGEFLHNLRSALDNLVWQLVLLNGEQPWDQNQFPIYTYRAPRPPRMDKMLRGVRPDHRAQIEDWQPYRGAEVYVQIKAALAWLALLSNIDKHRFLHPTITVLREGDATAEVFEATPGAEAEVIWTAGPLHDGAELMRWRVTAPEAKVTMGGQMSFPIAFGDPRVDLGLLDAVHERVGQVIERFAADFEGGGAKVTGS
jgi:hypothetical protein